MSVATRADELKEQAITSFNNLILELEEMVNPNTWGSEDFRKDYLESVEDVLHEVRKLRRKFQ